MSKWSKAEVERLKRLYPRVHGTNLYRQFPERSKWSVRAKGLDLGLRRPWGFSHYRQTIWLPRSPIARAYIAGLFDGEGCINRSANKNPGGKVYLHWHISIANTYRPVLEWLMSQCGGAVYTRGRRPQPHHKPCFSWSFTGHLNTLGFLQALLPYMKIKHEAARLALDEISALIVSATALSPRHPAR